MWWFDTTRIFQCFDANERRKRVTCWVKKEKQQVMRTPPWTGCGMMYTISRHKGASLNMLHESEKYSVCNQQKSISRTSVLESFLMFENPLRENSCKNQKKTASNSPLDMIVLANLMPQLLIIWFWLRGTLNSVATWFLCDSGQNNLEPKNREPFSEVAFLKLKFIHLHSKIGNRVTAELGSSPNPFCSFSPTHVSRSFPLLLHGFEEILCEKSKPWTRISSDVGEFRTLLCFLQQNYVIIDSSSSMGLAQFTEVSVKSKILIGLNLRTFFRIIFNDVMPIRLSNRCSQSSVSSVLIDSRMSVRVWVESFESLDSKSSTCLLCASIRAVRSLFSRFLVTR